MTTNTPSILDKAKANYLAEFPDYDPATMPPIPAEWIDVSWHNDACPSFDPGHRMTVFVDHADPAKREVDPLAPRFAVIGCDDGQALFASDDWDAVLAFVQHRHRAAMALHDVNERARALGWTVVKHTSVPGHTPPCAVVLCRIDNASRPFAVHLFNKQDGGFHHGAYCTDYHSADQAYGRKLDHYARGQR